MMRHLQRSIDSIDYKSRPIKRMDLELAALESKQSVKGGADPRRKTIIETLQIGAMHLNQLVPDRGLESVPAAKIPASMV